MIAMVISFLPYEPNDSPELPKDCSVPKPKRNKWNSLQQRLVHQSNQFGFVARISFMQKICSFSSAHLLCYFHRFSNGLKEKRKEWTKHTDEGKTQETTKTWMKIYPWKIRNFASIHARGLKREKRSNDEMQRVMNQMVIELVVHTEKRMIIGSVLSILWRKINSSDQKKISFSMLFFASLEHLNKPDRHKQRVARERLRKICEKNMNTHTHTKN